MSADQAAQAMKDGYVKEVISPAPDSSKMPKTGQKCVMHYVGTLVNGTKFDSSRDRGKPFEFVLGKGQVIKGWDVGVATMALGERAKLVISPEWGYGKGGYPPTIPGNSVLVFEVELLQIK